MKLKMALAAVLFAVGTAQAVEVGINGSRDYGYTPDTSGYGVTVGQKFGAMGITAGWDRYTRSSNDQNKWSLVGSYDVVKVGQATVAVKGGAAYLDNNKEADGYALLVGAGVSYPLTKQLAATADYRYQVGQDRVKQFDGNTVAVGLKYSF
jgi:outer membrane autotransporter protein